MPSKLIRWAKRRAARGGLQAVQVEIHGKAGTHMAIRYKKAAEDAKQATSEAKKVEKQLGGKVKTGDRDALDKVRKAHTDAMNKQDVAHLMLRKMNGSDAGTSHSSARDSHLKTIEKLDTKHVYGGK